MAVPEHSVHLWSHGAQLESLSAKNPMLQTQAPFFRSEFAQHPQMVEGAIMTKFDSQVEHSVAVPPEQVRQVP